MEAAANVIEPSTEMSYREAFVLATQLHRGGQLEPAEKLYRALREAAPADPNPMHYLGVLLHQRGQHAEAEALIRRSLAADPSVAAWHNNLGNVLLDADRVDDAAHAYAECARLDADNVEVLNNLGVLQRGLAQYDRAEATLKRAVERRPDFIDAHNNLAALYFMQRRVQEGYVHSAAVLALQPRNPHARRMLGVVCMRMGRLDEAAAIFREWLELEPGDEQAEHYLAACTGVDVPERARDAYVVKVFDQFAESFDAKLAALEYRAPQLVGEEVALRLGAPRAERTIVDAGCGTGLCARFLAPYAARLVGVDLSPGMLARAGARNAYAELVQGELTAELAARRGDVDVVVSADTLCYFGALEAAFAAARRALRHGGLLVFTVEAHDDAPEHRLNPHGRYSHRREYLERALDGAGFADLRCTRVHLRNESCEPVAGWLVSALAVQDAPRG